MRIGVHIVEHVCRRIAIQINRSYRGALARAFRVCARVLTRADAHSMRAHAHTGGSSSICFCIICSISMRIRKGPSVSSMHVRMLVRMLMHACMRGRTTRTWG
jgi:hypothetical protein